MQEVAVYHSPRLPAPVAAQARGSAVPAIFLRALVRSALVLAVPAALVIGAKLWVFGLAPEVVLALSVPLWLVLVAGSAAYQVAVGIRTARSESDCRYTLPEPQSSRHRLPAGANS